MTAYSAYLCFWISDNYIEMKNKHLLRRCQLEDFDSESVFYSAEGVKCEVMGAPHPFTNFRFLFIQHYS